MGHSARTGRWLRGPGRLVTLLASVSGGPWSAAQQTVQVQDAVGDAQVRRADPEADGPVDPPSHRLPDAVSYEIGFWQPIDPRHRPFEGSWTSASDFFRLDVVFDGLVNPPGTLGGQYGFDPWRYGPHPVFGYLEIDMDADVDTGGELDYPDMRYLGNAARYGGLPSQPRFAGRAALDYTAFDGVLATPPFVDRSGEEFHIALHGWEITEIDEEENTPAGPNGIFEPGERWEVEGYLFHRAHGYEPFSFACPSSFPGSYEPEVEMQFQHSVATNRTTVSLVYPLNNVGSAQMQGDPEVEPLDCDPDGQNSALEAMDDLVYSAVNAPLEWRSDPDFPIIERWATKDPNDYLDPTAWQITVLTATSYTVPQPGTLFVWTDLVDSVVAGDFDGSGAVDDDDLNDFDDWLEANDGNPAVDEDGQVNGVVDLIDFGPNFSVFDVNYDGLVGADDRPVLAQLGDFDGDGDVDLSDFTVFQLCFGGSNNPPAPTCPPGMDADLDGDGDVDLADFLIFQQNFTGSR